MDKGKLLLRPK